MQLGRLASLVARLALFDVSVCKRLCQLLVSECVRLVSSLSPDGRLQWFAMHPLGASRVQPVVCDVLPGCVSSREQTWCFVCSGS